MKGKKKGKKLQPKQAIVKRATEVSLPEAIEQALINGDLTNLTVAQRLELYKARCKSLGLNWLTEPFGYIAFRENENTPAKLVLYAKKDCAEQLRKIHGIGVTSSTAGREDGDMYVCRVTVVDKHGKTDTGTGAVSLLDKYDKPLKGKHLANAIMKAETKAKRRATYSAAGLGVIDESELETMDTYAVSPTGRVVEIKEAQPENPHPTSYEQREQEALAKLSPAQREVLERKMAKAKESPQPSEAAVAASPEQDSPGAAAGAGVQSGEKTAEGAGNAPADYDGLTCTQVNGMYHIDGPTSRLREVREVLKPFWMKHANPPGIFCKPEELGKLMRKLEEVDVKFRIV